MAKPKTKNTPAKGKKNLPVKREDVSALITQDAGEQSGFDNMGADDLAIPFIVILQSGSPQCKKKGGIKGAAEGLFFNTVTNEVLGEKIKIIPCAYERSYVEWILRENGGGFIGKHADVSILSMTKKDNMSRDIMANGHQIVTTAYHYCLLLKNNGTAEQVVIGLTSTQLKKSRKWNSQQMALQIVLKDGRKIRPPMYSHIYEATSTEENNDKGEWSGWVFGNSIIIKDSDLYTMAKMFNMEVGQGTVKTVTPQAMEDIPVAEEETF